MSSQAETIAQAGLRPSDAEIQHALAQAVRSYVERAVETDNALSAFPPAAQVTATEVMVTVTAMLKAVNLQVFELGMWQAWARK
jgi:hypothetical protein